MTDENTQSDTAQKQPEIIELKHNSLFKFIGLIGFVAFTYGSVSLLISGEEDVLAVSLAALFSLLLLLACVPSVTFDKKTITYRPLLGIKTSFTWDDIDHVSGHSLTEAIRVRTKNGKRFTISGQYPRYPALGKYLRHLRRDLFTFETEQVFKRRPIINLLLVGVIAGGIAFTRISSAGWVLGLPIVFSGLFFLLWIPYSLTLFPSDELMFRSYLKTMRFASQDIDIKVTASKAIMDTYHQVAIHLRGSKGNIPLSLLSDSNVLLFASIRTWWENRISFLTYPIGYKEFGPCECCGNTSLTAWGELEEKGELAAVYYVHWTAKRPDHGASFDLVIGKWGEEATAEDRYAISLLFRIIEGTPQFMVIDANDRPIAESDLVGTIFTREQVINSPLKKRIFMMVNEIYLQDNRIAGLRVG